MAYNLKGVEGGSSKTEKNLIRAKTALIVDVHFPISFPLIVVFIFWMGDHRLGIVREAGV